MGAYKSKYGWTFDDMGIPISDEDTKLEMKKVCGDCAEMMGGEWPKDHVANYSRGVCSACHREHQVCSPRNWQLNRDGTMRKKEKKEIPSPYPSH